MHKKSKISRMIRAFAFTVIALGVSTIVSGAVSLAACCEVTNRWGEKKYYNTFSEGWCYVLHSANPTEMTTIKLLANWEASKSKTSIKARGSKYSIGKYNLGTDLQRRHVEGLDNSKSEVDGFSGGHMNVPGGKLITIDLNGFNIDRKRGNDQNDDGEVINVKDGGNLTIIDSNPSVSKNISGVQITGGAILGGASEDGAGGIHIKNGGCVKMIGGNIGCCQTNDHGGAIKVEGETSQLTLDGVTLFKNKTRDAFLNTNGGAIYVDRGKVRIRNCVFNGNESEDYGGAIFADEVNSYIVIEGSKFINNEADDDGGAIYIDRGNLRISGTVFEGNEADDDGGAIYINDEDGTFIRNCTFTRNVADDAAGGLYINDDLVFLVDCDFHDNRADGYGGGGIYVDSMHDISIQGVMKVYNNKGKKGRADNLFLQHGKASKAYLYSGGLLDGSKIGIRTNQSYTAIKNITQYEYDEFFFSDAGSFKKDNVKAAKEEVYLASVFTDTELWIMGGLILIVCAGTYAGLIYRGRRRKK